MDWISLEVFIGLVVFFVLYLFIRVRRIRRTKREADEEASTLGLAHSDKGIEEEKSTKVKEKKEEWDDDFIDEESFDFLLCGFAATILFLVFGLFTGNPIYIFLIIFLITAGICIYYISNRGTF